MTIGREVGLGIRQQHVYGSRCWLVDYQARAAAERYNASLKAEQRISRGQVT